MYVFEILYFVWYLSWGRFWQGGVDLYKTQLHLFAA